VQDSTWLLTVHFQNGLVVSLTPEDFPLEKIAKPGT
jgi:hypothetical protein